MSIPRTRQRVPVSCEPCRIRKIRCPRDTPPCGSCVRRRIPAERCVYRNNSGLTRTPPRELARRSPKSPRRPLHDNSPIANTPHQGAAAAESNADLRARIENLERLLDARTQSQGSGPPCPSVPDLDTEPAVTANPTGTLISLASGHVRYLPFTSSWRIVHRASHEASFPNQDSALTDTPNGPYPFGEHEVENRHNLLARLPPTEHYFSNHTPADISEEVSPVYENSDQVPLVWLALLFSVLGTAVLALDKDSPILSSLSRKANPWDRVTEISERYYTAAMKCLEADRYLWRHNISTLQALLNIIYGIHHSHGQTWTLLGLAHHLALSIGCHVDPATFSLDAVEVEERRRSWLGLMMLLCNQNMSMTGFDMHQRMLSSRVLLPAKVWDESILPGKPPPVAEPEEVMTPISYFISKSRLFEISSEICNPVTGAWPDNPALLRRLDAVIQAELAPWEQSYLSKIHTEYSLVHTNLLLSFAHHLVLLLHCTTLNEPSFGPSEHSWSKQRCMASAQRVLELHADFYHSPQFAPFHWYIRGRGAFHAFHAAFVLVLIFSSEPESPPPVNVLRMLHECYDRLEASRAHSLLCTRTATILRQILSSRLIGPQGTFSNEPATGVTQGATFNTSADLSNGQHFSIAADVDFPSFARQIEPLQWVNPINMDWDQWDVIMDSLGLAS
ncbi:hypothetical protein ARAM_004319 [Aspergillus rambellii]|uniref:Zn(2)-C6 fungal-type domain-containing protein n=1 Tax=Aspergillus rambellii TaxID=308745 RepID=A0A0F8UN86_9EURO|nr:hypothetical protein ARAM_004319 [Aspergillus rambellii]